MWTTASEISGKSPNQSIQFFMQTNLIGKKELFPHRLYLKYIQAISRFLIKFEYQLLKTELILQTNFNSSIILHVSFFQLIKLLLVVQDLNIT